MILPCWHRLLGAAMVSTLFVLRVASVEAVEPEKAPVVVLIGDSIRMGYAPVVAEMLEGKSRVIAAKENGGDSVRVLENLSEWAVAHQPAVVHFNCGLHDLKQSRTTKLPQVPLDKYEENLRTIVDRLQKETKARLVFATTTPIRDGLHAKRGGGFDRREADVRRYNEVALKIMKEKGVEIDDLHAVVMKAGLDKIQRTDGTHYTPEGSKVLAKAVSNCILNHLPASPPSQRTR